MERVSYPSKAVMPDAIRVVDAMRIMTAMERLQKHHHIHKIYPYHLVVRECVGYSEQHIRRLMAKLARMDVITRIGEGEKSRMGYALKQ
jgi:hypothetical protein